jgi:hypothetical protein
MILVKHAVRDTQFLQKVIVAKPHTYREPKTQSLNPKVAKPLEYRQVDRDIAGASDSTER